jgi:hypothetical protein
LRADVGDLELDLARAHDLGVVDLLADLVGRDWLLVRRCRRSAGRGSTATVEVLSGGRRRPSRPRTATREHRHGGGEDQKDQRE